MTDSFSKTNAAIFGVAIAIVAAGLGYGVAELRMTSPPGAAAASGDRQVLYWYDPMFPNQRFEKPGKSPFMDMQLVPKYANEVAAGPAQPGVRIDPSLTQNLGVRLATVERGMLSESLQAAGVIGFNERDVAVVQARSGGFVERGYQTAPGDVVSAGAPLADVYVSEWAGAQGEFLAVLRTGEADLIEAGRQRLRLLGMEPAMITEIERSGRPQPVFTIRTPIGGVIQSLNIRPGMTVSAGMTLAEINGLSTVWLSALVPEAQAGLVRVGQTMNAVLAAYPGEKFGGRVTAILPEAQEESRTLKVRIELPNRGARLRPGMYASVSLFPEAARSVLLVPSEALIRTGRRNLVMIALEDGRYQPAEVEVGREADGKVEILKGLNEGERVVASGQFLIDSEARLANVEARPVDGRAMPPQQLQGNVPVAGLHESRGRIEALSPGSVTLSHEPVPAIGWPAMTMSFRLSNPEMTRGLNVGDQVAFSFEQQGANNIIRQMSKTASAP